MINKTFCHIDGISEDTEKILWENGVSSWEYFIENFDDINCISKSKLEKIKTELYFSIEELNKKNLKYFYSRLPQKEHYRLLEFGRVAYLDIETTGLSKYTDSITLIGIYNGEESKIFIQGKNLNDAFLELEKYEIIVTFNGKLFDLPFIEQKSQKKYDLIHLDLRFLLKEFELTGGLKKIEKDLGINRSEEISNIDGLEAVRLWRKYKNGDLNALDKLIKYNIEDIVNLKYILNWYLEQKLKLNLN